MQDEYGRALDHVCVGSSLSRLGTTCANLDVSTSAKFTKCTSFSGINRGVSGRRSLDTEGVPISNTESLEDSSVHDQQVRHERVENGFKQDSRDTLSSRSSSQTSYICRSRDSCDQIIASINLSRDLSHRVLEVVDSSLIAQVGDNGDRVVVEVNKEDDLCYFDRDRALENGALVFHGDTLNQSNGSKSCSGRSASRVSPLGDGPLTPLSTDAEKDQSSSHKEKLPWSLEYVSYVIHLAVFGILGVFTRYLLQKLFGPALLALTGDQTPLYLDLPANMVGSFLMGWLGIVFKADIRDVSSDHIVVGLTTGYLGSLTTFSGWNQKMLVLSSEGDWVFAVAGIFLGMLLVNESIRMGVESADALRKSLISKFKQDYAIWSWKVDSRKRHITIMISLLLVLISLYVLSGILSKRELENVSEGAIIWVGCLVGPFGVWGRWYLAKLNGRGIGRQRAFNWLPVGTLSANVLAACLMAALSIVSKVVNRKRYGVITSGVEFGFLGCLSTVSTFVAEVYAMRQSGKSGRALFYSATTILLSFGFGTLIYSVPVWTKAY